jgi:hypothetical protein
VRLRTLGVFCLNPPVLHLLNRVLASVLCIVYWEHQQLQKQISEQTKQTRLYADYDMNATFDRLFDQSNEACVGLLILNCPLVAIASATAGLSW